MLRTKKAISQHELSRLTGLTVGYISRLERGSKNYTNPTIGTIQKLANAFNLNFCDFCALLSQKDQANHA